MAVFPATYFTSTTKYPESGNRITLANSYTFTSGPTAPDQRIFTVKVQAMQYFLTAGGVLDLTPEVGRNLAVLEAFYNVHKLHVIFDFTHPVYGVVKVKFNRPLEIPEGIKGGNGMVEDFDVELLEQP